MLTGEERPDPGDALVTAFAALGCRPLADCPEAPDPRLCALISHLAAAEAIDDQAVRWSPESWRHGLESRPRLAGRDRLLDIVRRLAERSCREGQYSILRSDVFDSVSDVLEGFVASMIWGYGRGWGWWRTAQIIEMATTTTEGGRDLHLLTVKLDGLAALARSRQTADLFQAWTDTGHRARLRRLGPAFASKFAYFAGYDRVGGSGPLIADARVAWGIWALASVWDVRTDADRYSEYLDLAERWAAACDCRSDEVERALFALGPKLSSAWRSRNQA